MAIKKFLGAVSLALAILAFNGFTTAAAEERVPATADKVFSCTIGSDTKRIKLNGTGESAGYSEITSGGDTIVKFQLPDSILDNKDEWLPTHVEILMMERQKGETSFNAMTNLDSSGTQRKIIQEIDGLKISLNIGKTQDYARGASYRIAYRVLMQSVADESVRYWCTLENGVAGGPFTGGGEDANYGWAQVYANGETFTIWVNTDPTMEVTGFIKSEDTFYKPPMDPSGNGNYANNISETATGNVIKLGNSCSKIRVWAKDFLTEGNNNSLYDFLRFTNGTNNYYVSSKNATMDANVPITVNAYNKTSGTPSNIGNNFGWLDTGNKNYLDMKFRSDGSINKKAFTLNKVDYWTDQESNYTSGNYDKTNKYASRTVIVHDDDGDLTNIKVTATVGSTKYNVPVYVTGTIFETEGGQGVFKYMYKLSDASFVLKSSSDENAEYGKYEIYADLSDCGIQSGSDVTLSIEILDNNGGEFTPNLGTVCNKVSYNNVAGAELSVSTKYTGPDSWSKPGNSFVISKTGDLRTYNSNNVNYAIGYISNIKETAAENRTSTGAPFITYIRQVGDSGYGSINTLSGSKPAMNYRVKATDSDENSGEYGIYVWGTDLYGNLVEASCTGKENAMLIDNQRVGYVTVQESNLLYTNLVPQNAGSEVGYDNKGSIDSTVFNNSIFASGTKMLWVNCDKLRNNNTNYIYTIEDTESSVRNVYSGIKEIKYNLTKVPESRGIPFDAKTSSFGTLNNTIDDSSEGAGMRYNKGMTFNLKETTLYQNRVDAYPNWVGICKVDSYIMDSAAQNNGEVTAKKVRGFVAVDNNKPEITMTQSDGSFEIENSTSAKDRNPGVDFITKWSESGRELDFTVHDRGTAAGNNLDISGIDSIGYKITDDTTMVSDGSLTSVDLTSDGNYSIDLTGIDRDAMASTGGIKYVHIVSKDKAGNRSECIIKLKINSDIKVTRLYMDDSSSAAIYGDVLKDEYAVSDLAGDKFTTYRIKKAIYDTNFRADIVDKDTSDYAKLSWVLTNNDGVESSNRSGIVDCGPNMNSDYSKVFNVLYSQISDNVTSVVDGVYKLTIQVVDYKQDADYDDAIYFGEAYSLYGNTLYRPTENVESKTAVVQVVVKRSNPPEPIITVTTDPSDSGAKMVTIEYPDEPSAPSLNVEELRRLKKEKYKAASASSSTGTYIDYTGAIGGIKEKTEIFAEYTDCVGNVSYATKLVEVDNIPNGEQIGAGSTDVKADENRSSNSYYIGTRKSRDASIDGSSVFNSMK